MQRVQNQYILLKTRKNFSQKYNLLIHNKLRYFSFTKKFKILLMKKISIDLSDYISDLVASFKDKRSRKNAEDLISKIVREQSIQLWSISTDSNEYERFHNLISGQMVNTLDLELLNKHLLINSVSSQQGQCRVVVVHDGSDIRKPESERLEYLGWVQALDGRWIKGYKTFSSVLIDNEQGKVKLLSCTPYSNTDPKFVSQKEMVSYEKGKLEDQARVKEIEALLEAEDNINSKKICFEQIQAIHDQIKCEHPEIVIIHVLDRGFDSKEIFEFIEALGDKYIIRFKSNRNSNEKILNDKGKEVFVKLATKTFEHKEEQVYTKIRFKKTVYHNAKGIFEWDSVVIEGNVYQVVRIRFYSRDGKKIFKDPMLLICNYIITTFEIARYVYELYLQRPKIEETFKFLKEVLGWETFRIHDFTSIKNLITLTFFIGGYFYEIEHEFTKHETVQWICKLGNGKGKVTRTYFLRGLSTLLKAAQVEIFRKEHNISHDEILNAIKMFAPK